MPRNNCVICKHPQAAEIESAITSGEQLKSIAPRYTVSPHSLSRHKRLHMLSKPASGASLEEQARFWLARADSLHESGMRDGDLRAVGDSIKIAHRALQLLAKGGLEEKREPATQSEHADDREGSPTIAWLDGLLQRPEKDFETRLRTTFPNVNTDQIVRIGIQLYRDPMLLTAVSEFMRERSNAGYDPGMKFEPQKGEMQ